MPTAHIMAMSIKVGKASIEIILCHSDQTMQKVEQFGRPIGVLFQIQTRKCVIAGTIPGHQPCFVLPLSTNFDLKLLIKCTMLYLEITINRAVTHLVPNAYGPRTSCPSGQTVLNQLGPHGQMVPKNLVPVDKWSLEYSVCPG